MSYKQDKNIAGAIKHDKWWVMWHFICGPKMMRQNIFENKHFFIKKLSILLTQYL